MRIWEFVITGGPCSGKSTGLDVVEQVLTKRNFKVIVVAETATELILSGITPKELGVKKFQEILIDRLINKEKTARKAARCFKKDVVILYDRGLLDSKAYMPEDMFRTELAKHKKNEVKARDQYDGVFHLVTAADGAEEFYTLENNAARTETPEEARELDRKTRNAWVGHPRLRIIDNSTPFKEKIDRLVQEISSVIGLPIPIQTKKRYLVKKPSEKVLEKVDGITSLNILQTYLSSKPTERRVRQKGVGSDFSYYYTEKKEISKISSYMMEKKISEKEYLSYLIDGIRSVRKTRNCFVYNNQYFELDIYPTWEEEAILEIELTSESQEVILPNWVEVIKDVTEDPNYKNYNLAK